MYFALNHQMSGWYRNKNWSSGDAILHHHKQNTVNFSFVECSVIVILKSDLPLNTVDHLIKF